MMTEFCIVLGSYERLLFGVDVKINMDDEKVMSVSFENRFILPAHTGYISALAVGSHYLATGSTDDTIKLYDMKRRKELGVIALQEKSVTSLNFFKKAYLFSSGDDGQISIYRCKDWELIKSLKASKGSRVNDFALHPSGKMGISVSKNKSMILWDLSVGKIVLKTKTSSEPLKICYSGLGDKYAVLYMDSSIDIYDIHNPSLVKKITPVSKVNSMMFYKESHIAYAGDDKSIYIYSIEHEDIKSFATNHQLRIKDITVVKMNQNDEGTDLLVTASSDGGIQIRQVIENGGLHLEPIGKHCVDSRITCMTVSAF